MNDVKSKFIFTLDSDLVIGAYKALLNSGYTAPPGLKSSDDKLNIAVPGFAKIFDFQVSDNKS
jgi:hypothetical protein